MKINPRSDYLKGHAKPEDIKFQPASLEAGSPATASGAKPSPLPPPKEHKKPKKRSTDRSANRETDQPASEPSDQPTSQSVAQSTDLSTVLLAIQSPDRKASRPAAFYITERQSEVLDALVSHFRAAHKVKTDRSGLLRAILREPVIDFYNEDTHEEIIGRLIDQLRSQLVGRPADRQTNNYEERQSDHQR